uniref:Uncharacterized protein n=1 Tax=Cannabis sativa TaxID=3483 RepID=A0A803P644_CANSA
MAHHHHLQSDHELINGEDRSFERSQKKKKTGLVCCEERGKQEEEKEVSRLRSELSSSEEKDDNGRERLKRHRIEMGGRVWIPDIWGQEDLLKDWIDYLSQHRQIVGEWRWQGKKCHVQGSSLGIKVSYEQLGDEVLEDRIEIGLGDSRHRLSSKIARISE